MKLSEEIKVYLITSGIITVSLTASHIFSMQQKMDIEKIVKKCEDGLDIVPVEGKGNGVVATKRFRKGELLCEYRGECLSLKDAKKREKEHLDANMGCFMYYFNFKNTKLWLVSSSR